MKKLLLFLTLFLYVFSCKSKDEFPKNIIPPVKMTSVLLDVFKADEVANYYRIKDSTWVGYAKHEKLYDAIYKIHHITKNDFQRSMQFYQGRPDLLKPILDSIQKYNDSSIKRNLRDTAHRRPMPV